MVGKEGAAVEIIGRHFRIPRSLLRMFLGGTLTEHHRSVLNLER
jgi:hypothetical protein